ncbi:MAG TPA: ABC transporter permease [Phycisphaerae bacterium]|jgi:ABC-2 type transport system permease protein|nr:ABC transporter permease [Phycisphaerae bacterium]HRS29622.1 ABC transporter permease [Phycisphaerae bacterium]HRT43461.1 ABC transporter permease [Phycisphaerae bacterium]
MIERIRRMLVKEFLQALRDYRMRSTIFLLPLIQVLVFGYAITTDVKHVALAVYDLDNTVASRDLISRFAGSGYFEIVNYVYDDAAARSLLDHGSVRLVLRINAGFQADLAAGRVAQVQALLDGSDSNTAGIVLNYSNEIVGQANFDALVDRVTRVLGTFQRPGQADLQTRAWFNENLESRNFFVPGVIALIVTLITLMLTSIAVVREYEIGTIEQIMVTPIRPIEFILGKTVPFALIGFADVLLITAVGVYWFEVPIRGSIPLLLLATGLYLLTSLGVGLLISTISRTQQQALMTSFLFFAPAILLSGFVFPIANMPQVVQWLTYLNPLRYFLVIIRGIFLKGVGLQILWPQMVALTIIGVLTFTLAVRRFHKTLT